MNIYAIGCGDFIKIGISSDVGGRLSSLQTGSPQLLSVLYQASIEPARAVTIERLAHWKLKDRHERGEWFRIDPQAARDAIDASVREAVEVKVQVGLVLANRPGTLEYEDRLWLLESANEPLQSFQSLDFDEEDGSL